MFVALTKLSELDRLEREAFESVRSASVILWQYLLLACNKTSDSLSCLVQGEELDRVVFPVEDVKPIIKRSSILFLRDVVTQSIR